MAANTTQFFSFLSLSLTLFLSLTSLDFLASEHLSSSPTIASDQLNLWARNVQNEMPESIAKKLSPMTAMDSNYYSQLMMSENDKFSADSSFCSMAKLACDANLSALKTVENTYTTKKAYNIGAFKQENNERQDPFSFFRLEKLKAGGLVHLPNLKESLPDRSFLPHQIASRIPLSMEAISKVFPDITAVKTVKETVETSLSYCNAGAIEGETMSCPKSLEEMIGFAKSTLGGSNKKLISLTSKSAQGSDNALLVRNVKGFNAKKVVACHEAFLPFAAYFCHSLASTRLYEVDLVEPKTERPVNTMLAICHMDTSPWPKEHVAFEILKFGPGQGEACHWFTRLDLAWISSAN